MCTVCFQTKLFHCFASVGAYTGYSLLWLVLLATVMGWALQHLALKLGVVTGKHLAVVCREQYPFRTSMLIWIFAELAIIGSDIQEVTGSAIALQILTGMPLWAGCIVTGLDTFTFLLLHKYGVRKLEFFFAFLVAVMTCSFFANFYMESPAAEDIALGFVPRLPRYAISPAVGLTGAVIMPHNIYLHSALVLSRKIDRKSPAKIKEASKWVVFFYIILFFFLLHLFCSPCTFPHNFSFGWT